MTSRNEDDEIAPSVTIGYKITEKKSVNEYATLDAKYVLLERDFSPQSSNSVIVMNPSRNGKQVLESRTRSFPLIPMILERYEILKPQLVDSVR